MSDIAEVYRAANPVEADLLVGMLQVHGIEAKAIGNELASAVGEIPVWEAAPRIWVPQSDAEQARQLILDHQTGDKTQETQRDPRGWTCPRCDTEIESGFDICWNCQYNPAAC